MTRDTVTNNGLSFRLKVYSLLEYFHFLEMDKSVIVHDDHDDVWIVSIFLCSFFLKFQQILGSCSDFTSE